MSQWQDVQLPGPGLGKIEYRHVHDDGTVHSTDAEFPQGGWVSTPGEFPEAVRVTCTECGQTMQRGDQIELVNEL